MAVYRPGREGLGYIIFASYPGEALPLDFKLMFFQGSPTPRRGCGRVTSSQLGSKGSEAFLRPTRLYALVVTRLEFAVVLCFETLCPKESYAEALLAMLGIPLPPPSGAQPRHALDPAVLLQATHGGRFKLSSCS